MKLRTINQDDALEIIKKGESHFFDYKSIATNGQKTQKIASAFANADGGEFIVGIDDEKTEPDLLKRWNGANKIEDFNSHLQALNELNPSLDFITTFFDCPTLPGIVMSIKIEKSAFVHKTASEEVYLRQGAQSLKLTDNQKITELQFAKGASSFEDYVIGTCPPENIYETERIKEFLDHYSPKTDPLEYVYSENLLDNKTMEPRLAGVMLFSDKPQAFIPRKCAIKIVRYETKEDEPERDFLKETVTIEGSAYDLIIDSVNKTTEMMSSIRVWTTEGLRHIEYPPEAIWEIVTNAVIHRDYSISDDVQILIYDNRLEIISPGKLPGYVTVDNILDSRYARNHKNVRTLSKYKEAPNKDIGEGLNTAFEKMKEWKLKPPVIIEDGNYVKVIIPHAPLARPTELILKFLKTNPTINNRQARELTGIKSENLVKVEFYKLRDEGLLERVPGLEGPASAWRLTDIGKKEIEKIE